MKIQWFDFPTDLTKIKTERLDSIMLHNLSYIEYLTRTPRGLSAHDEERYYGHLTPLQTELDNRKANLIAPTQEKKMPNVTTRIKEGAVNALKYLENGDSIRRACQKAGISVTSLYHTTTPEQRKQAYIAPSSEAAGLSVRKPGRPKKTFSNKDTSNQSNDITLLQKELKAAHEYIIKLEHKLVKSVVFADLAH